MKRSYSHLLIFLLFICGNRVLGQRPNVIFILADDLGYGDLSMTGQAYFETPNIDQLARDGIFFTNHYSGSTVCAPSRSTLLTGLHTGHTPIRGNREVQPEGQFPLADTLMTIPKLFKQAGYVTGAFGKWGLGFPGSTGSPENQGIDSFYGYNCQKLAHRYYPEYLWKNESKVYLNGNELGLKKVYAPDLIHSQAMEFIKMQNEKTPFFLFIPLIIPHAELAASSENRVEKYRKIIGPEKEHLAGKGGDYGPDMSPGGYQSNPFPKASFAAMMEELDLQVGDIIHLLKEKGMEENTLIIFTSDNGPHVEGGHDPEFFNSNGPFRGHKRDLYEGGIRVPLIIKWPEKIQSGSISHHISAFWDFLPTFSQLVETPLHNQVDGISFLPTLLDQGKQESHSYLYWEFLEQGGKQAIRKGKWKGVKLNVRDYPERQIELFDLESDSEEKIDLAKRFPEVAKELNTLMLEAHQENPIFKLYKK
ncbi:arylsulfatase [Algoriphagus formosus]|uniref:arylsulfatase n=1 Tax=Algoriphagus formosus TaxID=2007308 RepID=UPI000C281CAC|nr:arylsulfatase [Algoriphagus formosus]